MASDINAGLDNWASNIPLQFRYATIRTTENSEEVLFDYYHMYHDQYIAGIWNGYRSLRVMVQEILLWEFSRLHKSSLTDLQDAIASSYSAQIRTSKLLIQEAIDGICASVPQYLGYSPDSDSHDLMMPSRVTLGANFLLWPLYVAGSSTSVSWTTRMWVVGRLEKIAEFSGIQQANFLAQALVKDVEVTEHLVEDVTQLPESDLDE